MKKIVLALFLGSSLFACSLVELEADPSSSTVSQKQQRIKAEIVIPTDEADASLLLAGTTNKQWKTIDFTLSNSVSDCRLDDEITFNANGTYSFSRGANSCLGEDNRSRRVGAWEFDFENNRLIFDKGTSREYVSEIIGFNSGELRLKGSYFNLEIRGVFQVK